MPSRTRSSLVDPTQVGIYHCASRCVRRASFRGRLRDGLDVSHRQRWVRTRMRNLASVFAIDVLDYGVLDNSLHSLLKIRPDIAAEWTDEEVVCRWHRLNRQQLDLNDAPLSPEDLQDRVQNIHLVKELRKRLCSLSWFMIMLKEPISRAANQEEDLSGHFFGERFSCERCETPEDVVQALVFDSLSPVHAGLAVSPEDAEFTGYGERCRACMEAGDDEESGSVNGEETEVIATEGGERGSVGELPEWFTRPLWDADRATRPLIDVGDDSESGIGSNSKPRSLFGRSFGMRQWRELLRVCIAECKAEGEELAGDEDEVAQAAAAAADESTKNHEEGEPPRDSLELERGEDRRRALIPEEMPEMLERSGFDRVRWAEAYRRHWRRFARLTRKSDELRSDWRRLASH